MNIDERTRVGSMIEITIANKTVVNVTSHYTKMNPKLQPEIFIK